MVKPTQLLLPSILYVRIFSFPFSATLPAMQNRTKPPKAYVVPLARKITPKEQIGVDYYRRLREKHHEGPYYSVIDSSASSAKKGSAARVNFDPFHGMPSYSARYQKKHRTLPRIDSSNDEYSASSQSKQTFIYSP